MIAIPVMAMITWFSVLFLSGPGFLKEKYSIINLQYSIFNSPPIWMLL
jgi:hypothetical protein